MKPEKKKVVVDGVCVSYVEAGPDGWVGAPLLLVHGFLVHSATWSGVMPALAGRFRVLAPDLPGFGDSDLPPEGSASFAKMAAFLNRFCEVLGVETAIVVGHSMGGAISMVACSMYPHRFVKGVFMDAAAFPFKAPLKGRIAKVPIIGGIIFKHLYGWGMFQQYFRNDVFHDPARIDMDRLRDFFRAFELPGRKAYMHGILSPLTDGTEVAPHVAKVKQPTLVIWGAHDTLVPIAIGHRLEREIPGARLEIVKGSGHPPQEECPEETARIILDFLK